MRSSSSEVEDPEVTGTTSSWGKGGKGVSVVGGGWEVAFFYLAEETDSLGTARVNIGDNHVCGAVSKQKSVSVRLDCALLRVADVEKRRV